MKTPVVCTFPSRGMSAEMEDSSKATCHAWAQMHKRYSSAFWVPPRATLDSKGFKLKEQRGRERNLWRDKSGNLFTQGRVEPRDALCDYSYWFQPTTQAEPRWPPTALPGPFCLIAQSSEQQGCWQAEVKWCSSWPAICSRGCGDRMAAIRPDVKGVFPVWVIFHPLNKAQLQYLSTMASPSGGPATGG